MSDLENEIRAALNRASAESNSDTPDFILAGFLMDCLEAWDQATVARETFYGREVGSVKAAPPMVEGIQVTGATQHHVHLSDTIAPRGDVQ